MAFLEKQCDHCGCLYQPTGSRQRWCLDCCPNSVSQRGKQLLVRYNLTQKQYDAMYFEQDGTCLICNEQEAVVVDHDHRCCNNENRITCGKCVRGLLCRFCNTDLQWYENNIDNVNAYLEDKMTDKCMNVNCKRELDKLELRVIELENSYKSLMEASLAAVSFPMEGK